MKKFKIPILLSVAIFILFVAACDKRVVEVPNYYIQNIVAFPDSIYADGDDQTFAEIKATVVDDKNVPLVGKDVTFKILQDSLGSVTAVVTTGSDGVATATFKDIGKIGTADIEASIANSKKNISVKIVNPPQPTSYHIERITASPDTIYADNNITSSEIEVLVKDEQNFAATGKNVLLRTDLGNLISSVTTDSSGIAKSTFWDSGEIGIATIEAFVGEISASVQVTIDEVPDIDPAEFTIVTNSNDINIDEVTTVVARAKNTLGDYVPDGTIITFETTSGFFQDAAGNLIGTSVEIQTVNGVAQAYYKAGTQAGVATVSAMISGLTVSEDITVHPGKPINMYLRSLDENGDEVNTIPVNSNSNLTIEAQVQDKYHNSVESDVIVNFTTTLGTIIPIGSTDNNGFAYSNFSPGVTAGSAQISAVSDSANAITVINVTSDEVSSLEFAFSGQVDIQVQGTGGNESFETIVNLYDMNGNLVEDNMTVYFTLLSAPAGVTINNVGTSDSTQAVNGQAIVSIISGTESGIVLLKAFTNDSMGNEISAIKSNIVVHGGPPSSIDFSIGGHNSSVDGQGGMGGGIWRVQIGANITDQYGNPVSDGTAVWFSLPEQADFASIEAASYVGNNNVDGDSLAGTAFTILRYEGTHTNESILVRAETGGTPGDPNNFFDEEYLVLPMQYPVIDMLPQPQNIVWIDDQNPPAYIDGLARVTVIDGQNNRLDNVKVQFFCTLGEPIDGGTDNDSNAFTELSGEVEGEHGRIDKGWRFFHYNCPPSPDGVSPGTANATLMAQILGTQVTGSCDFYLYRYPTGGRIDAKMQGPKENR